MRLRPQMTSRSAIRHSNSTDSMALRGGSSWCLASTGLGLQHLDVHQRRIPRGAQMAGGGGCFCVQSCAREFWVLYTFSHGSSLRLEGLHWIQGFTVLNEKGAAKRALGRFVLGRLPGPSPLQGFRHVGLCGWGFDALKVRTPIDILNPHLDQILSKLLHSRIKALQSALSRHACSCASSESIPQAPSPHRLPSRQTGMGVGEPAEFDTPLQKSLGHQAVWVGASVCRLRVSGRKCST